MSRAPRVKINNNLQVAVRPESWVAVPAETAVAVQSLWECPQLHGTAGLILLPSGPESKIEHCNFIQVKTIQVTLQSSHTILLCLSYGWYTSHVLSLHS